MPVNKHTQLPVPTCMFPQLSGETSATKTFLPVLFRGHKTAFGIFSAYRLCNCSPDLSAVSGLAKREKKGGRGSSGSRRVTNNPENCAFVLDTCHLNHRDDGLSCLWFVVVTHREGSEGQADAAEAVQGQGQENERRQHCKVKKKEESSRKWQEFNLKAKPDTLKRDETTGKNQ